MGVNGFILAAGLGTRFRPLTLTTPKPLIPVAGKPAIHYSLEMLQKIGAKEVVVNTHHLTEKVHAALGKGKEWGFALKYSDEPELLGTAGGFRQGWEKFQDKRTTVVLSSDVITNADLDQTLAFHQQKKAQFTVGAIERDNVTGSGILAFNKDNLVTRYLEKPTRPEQIFSHWINGSIYIIEPSVIDLFPPPGTFYDFSHDLFPRLIEHGILFYAYPLPPGNNYLAGIDSPELLEQVEADIMNAKVFKQ